MLKDITSIDGDDLNVAQSESERAANLLGTQIGDLEYAPESGIDLRYFLTSEFKIQNASFKAYLVQRLLEQQVNVVNVVETIETLFTNFTFGIGTSDDTGSLIA